MGESLAGRVQRLQTERREHKRAIEFHRRALAGVMSELTEIEQGNRRLGVVLQVPEPLGDTTDGEGVIHGRTRTA
jgi:hypothetical protein